MLAQEVGIPLEVVIVLLAVSFPAAITLMAWIVRTLSRVDANQQVQTTKLLELGTDVADLQQWRSELSAQDRAELVERRRYDFGREHGA